jgi:hypothetical protein
VKKLASAKTRTILETADEIRDGGAYRQVILECHPHHAVIRAKGLRRAYTLTYGAMYCIAVKIHMDGLRAEKLAARKAAKKGKRK